MLMKLGLLSTKVGDYIPISQAIEFLPKLGNKSQKVLT